MRRSKFAMDKSRKRQLYIIYVVTFIDLFAVSLAIPLMAPHLRELGASHFIISLASTLYSITQLVSGPIVGGWSDRVGRCRILLFTLGVCSACYIILGSTHSVPIILLSRIIVGCFKHTQILCKTLVADIVPTRDHSGALGTLSAVSGAGFVVGPAIGGHFAELPKGFMYVCWVVAASFWVNVGLVYVFLMDLDRDKPVSIVPPTSSVTRLKIELESVVLSLKGIDWQSYGDVFGLKLLLALAGAFYFNNYSLSLQERFQLSPSVVGYMISFVSLAGAISGILSPYVQRAYMRFYGSADVTLTRIIHAFALLACALLGQWGAASLVTLIPFLAPVGASKSVLRDLLTELLIHRCPTSQRGAVVGSAHSMSAVARMAAPLIAGVAVDSAGATASVALAQLTATGGLVLSLKMSRKTAKRRVVRKYPNDRSQTT